jgi:hypothetical protein
MNTLQYGEFVARPVTRQAIQWDGGDETTQQVVSWMLDKFNDDFSMHFHVTRLGLSRYEVHVKTDSSKPDDYSTWQAVLPGDWIIRGENGGYYACSPKAFAARYTPVGDVPSDAFLKENVVKIWHDDRKSDKYEGGDFVSLDAAKRYAEIRVIEVTRMDEQEREIYKLFVELMNYMETNSGLTQIMKELHRFVESGLTPNMDDDWVGGELAMAAACYALPYDCRENIGDAAPKWWPGTKLSWQPGIRMDELIQAGAYISRELDRLNRLENKASENVEKMAESVQPPLNPLAELGGPAKPPIVPGRGLKPLDFPDQVSAAIKPVFIPETLDEAVDYLVKNRPPSDAAFIRGNSLNEFIAGSHMFGGMSMRNSWGLWFNETAIGKFFQERGLHHGDDRSAVILKAFWCKMNDKPFSLDTEVAYYRDYWANAGVDPDTLGMEVAK